MPPSTGSADPRARRAHLPWAGIVALAAVCVYLNALSGGFVYDDTDQVVANEWIRDPRNVGTIFTTAAWDFAGVKANYYRPLMHLVFLAEHSVFGLWPPGFHAVNVVLHAAISVLVFLLAARLLRPGATRPRELAVPALAGLLFAVHPLHAEVVAWVAGVPDLTATLLGLLCLWLYTSAEPAALPSLTPRYVGAVACFFLALLGKETALLLPLVLVAYDALFRPEAGGARAWVKRQLPFAIAGAAYLVLRFAAFGGLAPVVRFGELSLFQIGLNAVALVAMYLGKLLLPVELNALYEFRPVTSLLEGRALLLVAVGLAVLAGGALLLAGRHRRAFLAWALGVVTLVPVLYVPALGEHPFADRYAYFPSVGFVLLVAVAVDALLALRPRLASALGVAAALGVSGCAGATLARNGVWHDELTLWRDTVARSPGSAVVHYNLGVALRGAGLLTEAIVEYRKAVAIEPSPRALNNLGEACRDAGALEEATAALRRAVELDPRYAQAHSNLAVAYLDGGRADLAIEHLRIAVRIAPANADYLNNLGTAYREAGLPGEAERWYQASLRVNPAHAVARRNLEALLAR